MLLETNRASTLHAAAASALHHIEAKERAMKRTNRGKKKLVLSRESLVHLRGAGRIIVADSGSLSCTGPDCGPKVSEDWPCSDICVIGGGGHSARC
jgi:hypothetical protein